MVLWQFARGDFPRLRPKITGETRENSIDRDSQVSTRRELERLDILFIVATALLKTFGIGRVSKRVRSNNGQFRRIDLE
jgi:hypothetical protein